jgi:hypothetical protein
VNGYIPRDLATRLGSSALCVIVGPAETSVRDSRVVLKTLIEGWPFAGGRQPAVDSAANCWRCDWAARAGASGVGPNRTRWLLLRPPEGSDRRYSRPLFSNSQPDLPLRRPGRRGVLSLYRPAARFLALRRTHPTADLSSAPASKILEARFGDEHRQYKSRT